MMHITGGQKVKASQYQVFHALLNPIILQRSIPGCKIAEFLYSSHGRHLKLIIVPNLPGLKEPCTVFSVLEEIIPCSRIAWVAEPYNAIGSIKATCITDIQEEAGYTYLRYSLQASFSGDIVALPNFMLRGAAKVILEYFFKHFEQQINAVSL